MNNQNENKKLKEIYKEINIKENFKQCLQLFHKFQTLIDIGCANGYHAIEFINNLRAKKYFGVDISETIISNAKKNIRLLIKIK